MKQQHLCALPILVAHVASSVATILPRQDSAGNATITLSQTTGAAEFLASGFLYGFPDNGTDADTAIPSYFLTEMKFRTGRGGGSQIEAVGWATGGYDGYLGRFQSALSNYRSARQYGGTGFALMASDLWGAQGGAPDDFPFPGDNGNWTEMEAFLTQLITDVQANDMLDGLVIDLWNEPDLSTFWNRDWSQYVEYFVRATTFLRANFPGIATSGPSSAHSPHIDNQNWKDWMASIAANDAAPDRYSWHQIGAWEREPDTTVPALNELRDIYGLPERPIDVNEYAWPDEQNPANTAFFISQFERHDIRALRANWGGGTTLHDYMANLVWKDDQGYYYPNGEWYLYKYYGGMAGDRLRTNASADLQFDTYAVRSDNIVNIIAGTRSVQQVYNIVVKDFSALGLSDEGSLTVHRYQFDWTGTEGRVWDILDLGTSTYAYSGNELVIPFDPPTAYTAFAFEIQLY